jgi:hypothetical protein
VIANAIVSEPSAIPGIQRATRGRHLLHDQRQLVHACATAAVFLGEINAQEAEFAGL